MKQSFIDEIKQLEPLKADETLHQHDIKLKELSIRLDQLENILFKIQQKYPAFWDGKE